MVLNFASLQTFLDFRLSRSLPNRIDDRKKADLEQLKLDTWKALHNHGEILTRINDRAYLERCSTLSLSSQQSGAVRYAFDRIITEIEENEK